MYIGATELTDIELTDMDVDFSSWLVDGQSIPTAGRAVCEAALALAACHAAYPAYKPERQHPKDLIPASLHSQTLVSTCSHTVHHCSIFRT